MGELRQTDCCTNCTDRSVCRGMCTRYMQKKAGEIRKAREAIENMMRRRSYGGEK